MEKLNRPTPMAFYDKYYAPNNAVLVVAGDVEPDAVKALAEKTYGKVAARPGSAAAHPPVEPEQNTRRTVTLADARVSVPSFSTQLGGAVLSHGQAGRSGGAGSAGRDSRRRQPQPALPGTGGQARHRRRGRRLLPGHHARRHQFHRLWRAARRRQAGRCRGGGRRRSRPHRQGRRHRRANWKRPRTVTCAR